MPIIKCSTYKKHNTAINKKYLFTWRTLNADLFAYDIDPNNDDLHLLCSKKQCERCDKIF